MTRYLLFFGLCSLAAAQTPQVDWRFAQPDADFKIDVNVQSLLKSEAVSKGLQQLKTQPNANSAQLELGLAMLRGVDRLAASVRQIGPNDTDALVLVSGSFDPAMISGLLSAGGKNKVKTIGPHSILIGTGDSFDGALARMSGPAAASALAQEPSDFWIGASAAFLSKQSNQPLPPMLDGIKEISIGLTLNDPPQVNVGLGTKDEAAAGATLLLLQQAVLAAPLAFPAMASATKTATFKQAGSSVRMSFVITPELMALAQQQAADHMPAQLTPLLGGAAKPTPPEPKNDGKIKIIGLDSGPKEIPAPK